MSEIVEAPDRARSLVALLRRRAVESPDRGYTWLARGEEAADHLTYAGLDRRARAIATVLAETVAPGERALLLYPPGLEFIAAFFGCLYARVIAVPAYPPHSRRPDPRLAGIAADCQPRAVLTTAGLLGRREGVAAQVPGLAAAVWVETECLDAAAGDAPRGVSTVGGMDIAFLQYTSGSTGTPKGVVVTHANLLDNLERIRIAFRQTAESVVVGWLPLFHDMGLIGNVLEPCYVGAECVLMSPAAFLQKPSRWLQAVHRFRGTTSGGPNFAYDLCARSASEAREGLDLSSWSVAFNGSEPVRRATLDRFAAAFASCGFRREALVPCYGLAEATLLVAAASDRSDGSSPEPVSCGAPCGEVVAVEPESGVPCEGEAVGEIWVAGPSVAAGYWGRPEETLATFGAVLKNGRGPYLRTGDLGFVRGGELVVCGRLKDLIILRGRNLYPQDLELAAEQAHPALRAGGGAAFSIEEQGEERLILACEAERHSRDFGEIADAIRRAVAEAHGVRVAGVALLRAGTIPKTSSGKIRRGECRARYLAGELEEVHRSTDAPGPGSRGRLLTRFDLLDLDPGDRAAVLTTWLCEEIARRARVPAEQIGLETGIAATGLDSLSLFDLQGRLEADLGLSSAGTSLGELSVAALRDLVLDQLVEVPEPAEMPPLVPGEVLGEHPLAPGQEALWFLEQEGAEGVLHLAFAARIGAAVDGAALLRAAGALVDRHPALRTTFAETGGEPHQQVHASLPPDVEEVEAAAWSPGELDAALGREARRRFDLAEGSPLRLRVFHCAGGERILLLVLHHLVGDFWSLAVLLRDWAALGATTRVAPTPVGAGLVPALTYTDFARWHQSLLAGPAGERLERYWLDRLDGAPLALDLPTDRPRPRVADHEGARTVLRLDSGLTGRVCALGRAHQSTLFTTLLAVFQALLGRLTGQDDLVIGSPTTGRRDRALDGVVGYFVNPVVLRADLSGDLPFAAHLARTRRMVAEALEYRDFPFAHLARRLQPVRDPGRAPVVQVFFGLQQAPEPELAAFAVGQEGARIEWDGLALESLRLDTGTVQVDLALFAAEIGESLVFSCEHATALFDPTTIHRLLAGFERLLAGAAVDPERPLADVPLLSEAELHQLRIEETPGGEAPGASVVEMFEEWVDRTPDAVAVAGSGEVLTYTGLDHRADQIAHRLRALGVTMETRVGLCLGRSPEMIAAVFGILKAGAAYVPLDPGYPRERLDFLVEDAGVEVVVGDQEGPWEIGQPQGLPLPGRGAMVAAVGAGLVPALGGGAPLCGRGDSLAYVIYTSGSTGRPKGVMVHHRGWSNLVEAQRRLFGVRPGDRVLQFASLSFDASASEIGVTLAAGATLVLGPTEELTALLRECTHATLPPAVLPVLAPEEVPGLETLIVAGEACPVELARRWAVGRRLINAYGPTEATVCATAKLYDGGERLPIGRPIDRVQAWVLDRRGHPVPPEVIGELCLGGLGLARGYLGRPDRTAASFVPHPFATVPGERLYRTGDLARRRPDGEIEFLGRFDHQVKIRGLRIELGEIEAALAALPGVREAVVVAREERLAAYVVGDASPGALLQALRQRLPEHLVPTTIVPLAALSLTPSGKVDRKALPAPERRGSDENRWPRRPSEEIVAMIWADLLGLERIGSNDSFFELGGHSLLAMQLMSRLRVLGVDLPVRTVFERPTVAGLASAIEEARRGGAAAPALPLAPVPRDGDLPLSFAQERLWFLDRLEPGNPAYNLPAALALSGTLDAAALEASLSAVVARHEALRTTFAPARQVIAPAAPHRLPRVDLSGLPAAERERELRRLADAEARRPFDLRRGPLLRTALLLLSEDEHVLLANLHHIAGDGWSLGILTQEIQAFYRAFLSGKPLDSKAIGDLPVQYADFAVWQRRLLSGDELARQLDYWRAQLAGAPAILELPTDRPRPPVQDPRAGRVTVSIPAGLHQQLAALSRRRGATLFMPLLAAFQTLLHRHGAGSDLFIGTPIAGRNHAATERLIGLFVNTLVLRARLEDDLAFHALLDQVRETALDAYAHQDLPIEKLVEELAPERSLAHTPLFQAVLVLQTAPGPRLRLPHLTVSSLPIATPAAKFDLTLSFEEDSTGLAGTAEYRTSLFDPPTVHRLLAHLQTLLEAVASAPGLRLSEIPLLAEAERQQLLVEWNEAPAAADAAAGLLLHELFEARVRADPEATALVCGDERLSYFELSRRARRLAGSLRARGVVPGSLVGLCLERSAELVAGILAILQAGGAYVPIDPEAPAARRAFQIEDAGVEVLLGPHPPGPPLPSPTQPPGEGGERARKGREGAPLSRLEGWEMGEGSGVRSGDGALAYVIYTSGSTGRPKGVAVTHDNVRRLFEATAERFEIGPRDVWTLFHSCAFDFSVWEIWGALLHGGTLVIVPSDVTRSPEDFLELLARERVTVLSQTPSAFRELIRTEQIRPEDLALRLIVFGGEALEPASLSPWIARHGDQRPRLVNMYGITETTVHVTWRFLGRDDLAGGSMVGRAIPGWRVVLLDPALQPVPIGVPGEIFVGGSGVAVGYLGRPALTAERFVPDPFGGPGERLYRSGDLARRRPDGDLEYLGRIDHQIKVRGFRIELGEIEAALAGCPGVRQAVVAARSQSFSGGGAPLPVGRGGDGRGVGGEVGRGDLRLIAYITGEATPTELRQFLRDRLPAYMVPSTFASVASLPLTPNGKVDRQALAALAPESREAASGEAPRSPTEELLAGIWAEVLGVERVGADESFFDLGGHSLLATRAVSRLRSVFGVEVPLRALFEEPTVAGLARRIEREVSAGIAPQRPPIERVPRGGEMPLSFAQQRIWLLHRLAPGSAAFNISAAARLEGLLDPAALEAALGAIERRHEILRTTFPTRADLPVQAISPATAPRLLSRVDLSELPAALREAELGRLAREEDRRAFDLSRGPVWRTTLVRLDAADHGLLLTLHHIAGDAWSVGILVRELGILYAAFSRGLPAPLPELPVQFADFAAWQRCLLDGGGLAPELAWWRERLAGAPAAVLPPDLPHRPEQPIQPARLPVAVDSELTRGLATVARSASATRFMAVLAAFQAVLALHTGRHDLVAGSNVANRNRLETEGLIGCFLNVLVLRTDLSGDPSFEELLHRVREAILEASARQDLPFDRLVQELTPSRAADRTPLFQVKVDLLPAAPPVELSGLRLRLFDTGRIVARYDLHLSLREEDGGLHGELFYDAGRFAAATVERLRSRFGRLLAEAVRTPGARLSELGRRLDAAETAERKERRQELGRANLASLRQVRRRPLETLEIET